jgi:hypothetical protein
MDLSPPARVDHQRSGPVRVDCVGSGKSPSGRRPGNDHGINPEKVTGAIGCKPSGFRDSRVEPLIGSIAEPLML